MSPEPQSPSSYCSSSDARSTAIPAASPRSTSNVVPLFKPAVVPKPVKVDMDTLAMLKELTASVMAGETIGVVFACLLKNGGFSSDVSGACHANLTMTRGMVAYLGDQVAHLQHLALRP